MIRVTDGGQVLYVAEKRPPQRFPKPASADLFGDVARNFQVFDPLDFIAELTQHIPEPNKHLVRYFGGYSSAARGRRAKARGEHHTAIEAEDDHTSTRQARGRWAALVKRVWRVDPLECPRCGRRMKIVSFINPAQQDVIDRILEHCGLSSRAPPAEARAPPAPPIRQLTYVSDLQFVPEPEPAEPIWSAD
jgi:hypothetical protein